MKQQGFLWGMLALAVGLILGGGYSLYVLSNHVQAPSSAVRTDGVSVASVPGQATASSSASPESRVTCELTTDKRLYALGEPVVFSWTSHDATRAAFNTNFIGPEGSGGPSLPSQTFGPTDSYRLRGGTTGYQVVELLVSGAAGSGSCTTSYFVGAAGSALVPETIAGFADIPTAIRFPAINERSTSADGSLAFTLVSQDEVKNADGSLAHGHAIFIVRDRTYEFPVYLVDGQPFAVQLSRGRFTFTATYAGGDITLGITR